MDVVTPAVMISRLDRALAGYGQTVTLRHLGLDDFGAETVVEEVTCPAKVRPFGPQDLEAGEVLPIQVVLSPTSLGSFEIGRDDPIVIDGNNSNVQQIAPLYYGGRLVRVNLLCRG